MVDISRETPFLHRCGAPASGRQKEIPGTEVPDKTAVFHRMDGLPVVPSIDNTFIANGTIIHFHRKDVNLIQLFKPLYVVMKTI